MKTNSALISGRTTDELIVFFGHRRSGNHALLYWLFGQLDTPCWYSDNNKTPFIKLESVFVNKGDSKKLGDYKYGIINFEEKTPDELLAIDVSKAAKQYNRLHYVMVLRDPFNWLASRLQWTVRSGYDPRVKQMPWFMCTPEVVAKWKVYARIFLGEHDFVEQVEDLTCISYNKWFVDEEYRKSIATKLGLTFDDRMLNYMAREGGGSSFDKHAKFNEAQKLKVLDRWETFKDDDFYKELLDSEVFELSERIFNFAPGELR